MTNVFFYPKELRIQKRRKLKRRKGNFFQLSRRSHSTGYCCFKRFRWESPFILQYKSINNINEENHNNFSLSFCCCLCCWKKENSKWQWNEFKSNLFTWFFFFFFNKNFLFLITFVTFYFCWCCWWCCCKCWSYSENYFLFRKLCKLNRGT